MYLNIFIVVVIYLISYAVFMIFGSKLGGLPGGRKSFWPGLLVDGTLAIYIDKMERLDIEKFL